VVVDKVSREQGLSKQLTNKTIAITQENNCKRTERVSAFLRKEALLFYETIIDEKMAYLFPKKLN